MSATAYARPRPRWNRADIAGVTFDLIDARTVLETICEWREAGRREYITLDNPHAVMLSRRDPRMSAAMRDAALNLPDGVGIVLAASILSLPHQGRVTGPESMLFICDQGRRFGLTHYLYGGADGTADKLAERLRTLYPGIRIVGTYAPPFRPTNAREDAAIIDRINRTAPDLVWVGLGAPKQEIWMSAHRPDLNATALIGVGAAFDFHSGNVRWCPKWLRAAGLEWAYRLTQEPRRLWRRSLNSAAFLAVVLKQRFRGRDGGGESVFSER